MKLMDFDSDHACDVVCDLMPHIEAIMANEEISRKLQAVAGKSENMTQAQYVSAGVKILTAFVPYLLKEHRANVFAILAAVNDKTVEDVAEQRFGDTLKEVKDALHDPELMELFT